MATSEHGFTDHDSTDLVDWEAYRKFCEEEGYDPEEEEESQVNTGIWEEERGWWREEDYIPKDY